MDVPVVLAGDLTIVPTEFDIYLKYSYDDAAVPTPVAHGLQAASTSGLERRGTTAYRDDLKFSYGSYMRDRWPRDARLQLDFLLLSPQCASRVVAADVDRWIRGETDASDHAPVWATLEDA